MLTRTILRQIAPPVSVFLLDRYSLDTALEWSEEMVLKERRSDALLGRGGGRGGAASRRFPLPPTPMQSKETPPSATIENRCRSRAPSGLDEGAWGAGVCRM